MCDTLLPNTSNSFSFNKKALYTKTGLNSPRIQKYPNLKYKFIFSLAIKENKEFLTCMISCVSSTRHISGSYLGLHILWPVNKGRIWVKNGTKQQRKKISQSRVLDHSPPPQARPISFQASPHPGWPSQDGWWGSATWKWEGDTFPLCQPTWSGRGYIPLCPINHLVIAHLWILVWDGLLVSRQPQLSL